MMDTALEPDGLDSTPSVKGLHFSLMSDSSDNLDKVLAAVAAGTLSPPEAAERLRRGEVRYLDELAVLDLGRAKRKGVPEIVYAPGKTAEGVAICASILVHKERASVSKPTPEQEGTLRKALRGVPVEGAGRALVVGTGAPSPT